MPYYGPGMPWYGRGAGNIDAAARESARIAEDLEANVTESSTSSPTEYIPRKDAPYVGRGGAGNYGSPTDEAAGASFASIRLGSQPQSPSYGRGGAGNYAAGAFNGRQNASRKPTEDDQKREKLAADIERDVEEQLATPPKAKLSPGRRVTE